VAQLHSEHLTTEQLSAFFDNQLSPQEQAVFHAHLSTCQQCQSNLSDLRLTVVLLRALPESEVPRSFVLPGSLAIVPDRTTGQGTTLTPVPQRQRTRLSPLRRSIRVVSTLAAVLALFFLISGLLPFIYSGGGSTASTATSNSTSRGVVSTPNHAAQPQNVHTPAGLQPQEGTASKAPTPVATHHPAPTATTQSTTGSGTPSDQTPSGPSAFDLGQPAGRLSLGVLLLALSIIGLIVTRRRRVTIN
jgi:hypothetical protein